MRILSIRMWHELGSSRSMLATEQKAVIREEQKQAQLEAGPTARAKVEVVVQTRGLAAVGGGRHSRMGIRFSK